MGHSDICNVPLCGHLESGHFGSPQQKGPCKLKSCQCPKFISPNPPKHFEWKQNPNGTWKLTKYH